MHYAAKSTVNVQPLRLLIEFVPWPVQHFVCVLGGGDRRGNRLAARIGGSKRPAKAGTKCESVQRTYDLHRCEWRKKQSRALCRPEAVVHPRRRRCADSGSPDWA